MNRDLNLSKIKSTTNWDIIVIGGGASGLGVALDACSRNLKVLLIEAYDFGKGTSSRSTKLVHGGVRYLKNGEISLVIEALKERGLMLQNAPHLVRNMSFVIPTYDWWNTPFYGAGLKVYDLMAGKLGLGPSKVLSKKETIKKIPNVNQEGLNGGIIYHDGQFDDARMAISLAHTIEENGGTVINYFKWDSFCYENGKVSGIHATDQISRVSFELKANVVVNATGVFAEKIMKIDDPNSKIKIKPSQGVHLVFDRSFLKSENAIMVPNTSDGRVLFAVPWHDAVVVGTTDHTVKEASIEPQASEDEIQFILDNAEKYMTCKPKKSDIKSIFTGLRPLISHEKKSSKSLSRKHAVIQGKKGVVHLLGGKWTTYRKMGQDTIDHIMRKQNIKAKDSQTEKLQIFGYQKNLSWDDPLYFYGSEKRKVQAMGSNDRLSPTLPITEAQIHYAIKYEMALTIEDVLSRRTRCLLLNAKESMSLATKVAEIMAHYMKKDKNWEKEQTDLFIILASNYNI